MKIYYYVLCESAPANKLQNNNEDSRQVKKDRYSDLLERVGQYKQYRDKDGVISSISCIISTTRKISKTMLFIDWNSDLKL